MDNYINLIIYIILIPLNFLWFKHRSNIAKIRIENWLVENGYSLINKKIKLIFKGPFENGAMLFDMVYFIELVDNNSGSEKKCWLRLGSIFLGLFSKKIDCIWI